MSWWLVVQICAGLFVGAAGAISSFRRGFKEGVRRGRIIGAGEMLVSCTRGAMGQVMKDAAEEEIRRRGLRLH